MPQNIQIARRICGERDLVCAWAFYLRRVVGMVDNTKTTYESVNSSSCNSAGTNDSKGRVKGLWVRSRVGWATDPPGVRIWALNDALPEGHLATPPFNASLAPSSTLFHPLFFFRSPAAPPTPTCQDTDSMPLTLHDTQSPAPVALGVCVSASTPPLPPPKPSSTTRACPAW